MVSGPSLEVFLVSLAEMEMKMSQGTWQLGCPEAQMLVEGVVVLWVVL